MDPRNAQPDKREVQLEGERLERVRRQRGLAQDQLMSLADVVLPEVRSERVAEDVAEIRVSINAENAAPGPRAAITLFLDADGNCIGSYRDPPESVPQCANRPLQRTSAGLLRGPALPFGSFTNVAEEEFSKVRCY